MTVDLKIMLQRRGNSADLPTLQEGQLGITLDKEELYFGTGTNNLKVINTSEIVDNLNSTDTEKVLSANQGNVLNGKLQDLESYTQGFTNNFDTIIKEKQDVILIKSDNPPALLDKIWYNTSN